MTRDNEPINDKNDGRHIARHLDGKPGRLTGRQARVAREVRDDQRWLGGMLDVATPPAVLEKAFRRLDGAMARRRPRRIRLFWPLTTGAIAAAVVVVALVGALAHLHPSDDGLARMDPTEAIAQFLAEEPIAVDAQLAAVDEELTVVWTDLVLEDEFGGVASTEAVDRLFEEFWLADPLEAYTDGGDLSL